MTSKVLELEDVLDPDNLATQIAEQWITWDNMRQEAKGRWREIREYVYATDTTQTTNSQLQWKNKTTIPKLCQIRDNLYANYTATLFPQRKWLIWEANEKSADSKNKRDSIVNYMNWAITQPSFKHEIDKIILDYIDYGNCFGTIDWVDERVTKPDGTIQSGYVGPGLKRISPLNICFNPTAESFENSPKIIRSIVSFGEVKEMLERMSNDENREEYEKLWTYLKEMRSSFHNYQGEINDNNYLYHIDGFSSFSNYLMSDFCEVLTFYGDMYDTETGEFLKNHVITVVDRHKIIGKKPNPSYFGTPPIFQAVWRKRQDNLWGMGPLDNLVGLQYRLDHLENMKADTMDLVTYPVQKIRGFVEPFTWQPGEKIYVGEEGDVEMHAPPVQALQVNLETDRIMAIMEEMAGAPKEAMGFRTPGEKTKYEVQRLENAASRLYQNKTKQFEEFFTERVFNGMLEQARRNLTGVTTIRVMDDEFKMATFQSLTVEDITGIGRIKPVAARHFAEQAELVQNLTSLTQSQLWPVVMPHFSGVKLGKLVETVFGLEEFEVYMPHIAMSEQAEAQKMAQALQEQVATEAVTATGMGEDFDMDPNMAAMMAPPPEQVE